MTSGWKIGVAAAALLIAVPLGYSVINTATTVATAPGRVVTKTMQTDNIISTYEGFFAHKAAYDGRLGQIKTHTKLIEANADPAEASRLRIELAAMQQSCREMAIKYNADAAMMNKSLFRDGKLPSTLSELECDA